MKTRNKALLLSLCAVLLVAVSVLGTMAYLTSTTGTVKNTFTVGKVEITLDEAKVDVYGEEVTGANRVTANTYKLIPGHEYTKDPTVHVQADSEDCWLFVKVENDISAIEAATTIADQMTTNGWTLVPDETDVYAYKETVSAGGNVPVFGSFTLKDDADVASYGDAKINVTAYAVQADGFATAEGAWKDARATWPQANN